MDINDKIAARRAQLAREEQQAKADQAAETARVQAAQQQQRVEALDAAAVRLSTREGEVRRVGQHLVLKTPPPPIDPEVLTVDEAIRLLKQRAREMWTPQENRLTVGGIASGATIVVLAVALKVSEGLEPLVWLACVAAGLVGLRYRTTLNRKYLAKARADYPVLAAAADGDLPPEPVSI